MTTQHQIDTLDALYQRLSGVHFHARGVLNGREQGWHAFIRAGFTEADLREVVVWLRARIKIGKRDIGSLRFSSLILNLDRFDEELGLCRAERRNLRPAATPKQRVIEQARPTVSPGPCEDTARPVAFWIEQLRKAANTSH